MRKQYVRFRPSINSMACGSYSVMRQVGVVSTRVCQMPKMQDGKLLRQRMPKSGLKRGHGFWCSDREGDEIGEGAAQSSAQTATGQQSQTGDGDGDGDGGQPNLRSTSYAARLDGATTGSRGHRPRLATAAAAIAAMQTRLDNFAPATAAVLPIARFQMLIFETRRRTSFSECMGTGRIISQWQTHCQLTLAISP